MLQAAGLEASYVGTYAEDYLDAVENLPNAVQPHLSEVRRLDVDCYAVLDRLEEIKSILISGNVVDDDERKRLVVEVKELLYRGQMNGDQKLEHLNMFMETVDAKCQQLEHDAANLEPTQSNEVTRTTPASRRPSIGGTGASKSTVERPNAQPETIRDSRTPTDSVRAASRLKRARNQKHIPDPEPVETNSKRDRNDVIEIASNSDRSAAKKRTSGRTCKPTARKRQGGKAMQSSVDPDEPTYCLCEQVSFGEMIGCDYVKCSIEWFHFECVELKTKPKGKWYCPLCRGDRMNVLKPTLTSK